MVISVFVVNDGNSKSQTAMSLYIYTQKKKSNILLQICEVIFAIGRNLEGKLKNRYGKIYNKFKSVEIFYIFKYFR